MREHTLFKGCYVNLKGSFLDGASLRNARLDGVDLTGARLHRANLFWARLRGADLFGAYLQSAYLVGAQLQGARLCQARLHGASLLKPQLQGADLYGTQLHEADLVQAQLHGVTSTLFATGEPFVKRMRMFVGRQSELTGAIFRGGLNQQCMTDLESMPDLMAEDLRAKLRSHVGEPESENLPRSSQANTGVYSSEDAEKWIAEYEGPVLEGPNAVID